MVDVQPQTQQPISDDQELTKVLAGVTQQADENMQFEESPLPTSATVPPVPPADDAAAPVAPVVTSPVAPAATGAASDLEPIKAEAINELRPLVDKLTLPPEEKFDTYLLLLRSTDDKALIAPHTLPLRQSPMKRARHRRYSTSLKKSISCRTHNNHSSRIIRRLNTPF